MGDTVRGLGRCSCAFWLAVAFDLLGLVVLLLGVFANLFFYDFLIYAGAIIIFLSLIWWVFWYTGNMEVPPDELQDDVGLLKKERASAGHLLRSASARLSQRIRSTFGRSAGAGGQRGPRGAEPLRVPVSLAMRPQESLRTVSAAVGEELAPDAERPVGTSAI
ncbi:transmembrane protein 238-like [Scleropages formosus]|uniref:Transmembrane protein 238-like n=1 Tax=Scleropages formosus TaxID=113540 RepID=A0A0N8JX97_SCLFO|nr:transmembrane protein 238-like [Scleropages formosus]KPP63129.1 transmembrane protein 238-like [Scleropages formosus]